MLRGNLCTNVQRLTALPQIRLRQTPGKQDKRKLNVVLLRSILGIGISPFTSTEALTFEWSHSRILTTDSKVRACFYSIIKEYHVKVLLKRFHLSSRNI